MHHQRSLTQHSQFSRLGPNSCVCDVCREWVNEVGFFLIFPVKLVCYVRFSCTCMCLMKQHVYMTRLLFYPLFPQ